MKVFFSIHWLIAGGAWMFVNGILHDVFVLRAHKGPYNRDLLRLLMDGHLLILSGVLLAIGWMLLRSGNFYGAITGVVVALSMIAYCAMILPFLKSFVTLFISIGILCASIYQLWAMRQ